MRFVYNKNNGYLCIEIFETMQSSVTRSRTFSTKSLPASLKYYYKLLYHRKLQQNTKFHVHKTLILSSALLLMQNEGRGKFWTDNYVSERWQLVSGSGFKNLLLLNSKSIILLILRNNPIKFIPLQTLIKYEFEYGIISGSNK